MEVRHLSVEEKIKLDMIQSIAFLFPMDVAAEKKKAAEEPEKVHAEHTWGCFNDAGRLVSGLINTPYTIYYDGHIVGMGGIGGVASLPEERMQGGIRTILSSVFAEDRAMGRLFSVLFPFSAAYYRKFGYEVCNIGRMVRFPMEALSKYKMAGTARMYRPEEGIGPFSQVYERFASRYNYAVSRSDLAWENILHCDPLKAEGYPYILSRDGMDTAYCIFRARREGDGIITMVIRDYAYVNRDALIDLFGFLRRLSAQFKLIEMELPDDLMLHALFDDPYVIKPLAPSVTMARALDVGEALRMMRHPQAPGSYAIAVEDAFLPENTGTYHVKYGNGDITVMRSENDTCDLRVSIQAFTQLCLGYIPLEMALYRDDVRLYGQEDLLKAVFVQKPKFLFDRF